jgi:hypothetical protein
VGRALAGRVRLLSVPANDPTPRRLTSPGARRFVRVALLLALVAVTGGCDKMWRRLKHEDSRLYWKRAQPCKSTSNCDDFPPPCKLGPMCVSLGPDFPASCQCADHYAFPCDTAADCPTGGGITDWRCVHYYQHPVGICESESLSDTDAGI